MRNISVEEFKARMDRAMSDGKFAASNRQAVFDAVKECVQYALTKCHEYNLDLGAQNLQLKLQADGVMSLGGRQYNTIDGLIQQVGPVTLYEALLASMDSINQTADKYRAILAHRPSGSESSDVAKKSA